MPSTSRASDPGADSSRVTANKRGTHLTPMSETAELFDTKTPSIAEGGFISILAVTCFPFLR